MTIEAQPDTASNNAFGSGDMMVYVVSDATNVAEPKYRFIAEIYVDGVSVAKLKALPNSANRGVFDVSNILRDYIEPTKEFETTNFEYDELGSRAAYVDFGYEYAVSEDELPVETLSVIASNSTEVTSGTYQTWTDDYGVLSVDLYESDAALDMSPFISKYNEEGARKIKVSNSDYGTLSVFRPNTASSFKMGINFFDASGNVMSDGLGLYGVIIDAGNTLSGSGVAHLGVYPANLNNTTNPIIGGSSISPNDYVGWASYRLFNIDDNTNTYMIFEREEPCPEMVRFAWWNSLGTWDFFNAYGKATTTDTANRKTFRTYGGNAFTATNEYIHPASNGIGSGGRTALKRSVQVNTNWLPETLNSVVQDLFQSSIVYVYEENTWLPVKIEDTSITLKKRDKEGVFEYNFRFEYLNPIRTIG